MSNYFRVVYYLACLLRHTYWSREQLSNHQNKKVREIVKYAYNHVPFYHQKFLQSRVKPQDIKTVKDLDKLPIIRRGELQKNSEKLLSKEFDADKLKVTSTSGSTGRPVFTYLSKREDEFRKAKLLRPHLVCGQKPRDKWALIGPPQHRGKVGGLQRFLGIYTPIFVSVFDSAATQILALEKLKPDVLDGYSSSLVLLAREVKKKRLDTIRPRFMMGGAELMDGSSRKLLEYVFDAPFYDQYGSEELQMIAWQCPERSGHHIDADSLVMRFVDQNGQEVAPGEEGEIVCTSLFNYAMPFINYAVGDVGVPSEETNCHCGRMFPLMKVIQGRKDSIVFLPDGRALSPLAIGDAMMFSKHFGHIYQYRVIQKRIDFLRILINKKDCDVEDRVMEAEVVAHLRKMFDIDKSEVTFEVEFVDDIPLDKSGKLMKVVSELKGYNLSI